MASNTKRARFTSQEVYLLEPETAARVHALAVELGESKSGAARIILRAGLARLDELAKEDEGP